MACDNTICCNDCDVTCIMTTRKKLHMTESNFNSFLNHFIKSSLNAWIYTQLKALSNWISITYIYFCLPFLDWNRIASCVTFSCLSNRKSAAHWRYNWNWQHWQLLTQKYKPKTHNTRTWQKCAVSCLSALLVAACCAYPWGIQCYSFTSWPLLFLFASSASFILAIFDTQSMRHVIAVKFYCSHVELQNKTRKETTTKKTCGG